MTNSLTRMPDPASQWFWNGSQWVCGCDPDDGTQPPVVIQPPVPPPFFPPPITQPPWYPGANGGVSFGVTAPPNPIRGAFWWDGLVLWIFDGAAWVNTATGVTEGGGSGGGSSGSGAGTVVIGTMPPGNPVAGMQWWDGTVLRVWDGTKWNIVGPGSTAGPVPTTTNVFKLPLPTLTTVSANAWNIVPFANAPTIDTELAWNGTTHKITPTKAGIYLWFVRAYLGGPPGTAIAVGLLKNDPGVMNNSVEFVTIADIATGSANLAAWLNAGGISVMNGTTDFVRLWVYTGDGNVYATGTFPMIEGYLLP